MSNFLALYHEGYLDLVGRLRFLTSSLPSDTSSIVANDFCKVQDYVIPVLIYLGAASQMKYQFLDVSEPYNKTIKLNLQQ